MGKAMAVVLLVVFQELTPSYIDALFGRAAPGGGGGGAKHLPVPTSLDDLMTTRIFPAKRMEPRQRDGQAGVEQNVGARR
jgi:hypothetical protein